MIGIVFFLLKADVAGQGDSHSQVFDVSLLDYRWFYTSWEIIDLIVGVDRLLSTASPSVGLVAVELTEDAVADETLALVKNAVDK
ncbi:MAG: hypothetical protein AAFP08_03430, partial [Bacteroidota bacterium]